MTTLDEDVAAAEPETEAEEEAPTVDTEAESVGGAQRRRRVGWPRLLAYGVLPGLALLLALAAGYVKWLDSSARESELIGIESVHLATDSTIAMLSYKPDTVERDLGAARDRLTGDFKESYTSLTHDVVIPGSKQKHISAVATVPAAASVSASENHAVVLVFVNQTVVVGNDAPTSTASSVRVTLDKIGGRWLVSRFDPV
jgi:Mce-associated membrane protein